ncbi:MAG: hypothetical protein OQL16_07750 [Gammaproteobacteria bacterium]|nr:hypothetical protein [Gammaproteobacteria bacterium]
MSAKATVEIIDHGDADRDAILRVTILDQDLYGKQATLRVETQVKVDDSSPVHDEKLLMERTFQLTSTKPVIDIKLPSRKVPGFGYSGKQIKILLRTKLVVDDSVMFDTKIEGEHDLKLLDKPRVNNDAKSIIDPNDLFSFFANLKAIPAHNQVMTLMLVVVGGIVMLVNAVIGVHDQFVPEAYTWLYSHTSSDGEGSSPLAAALAGSGVLGAGIWWAMKKQLQKYMKFRIAAKLPERFSPGVDYPISKFFIGRARVPLEDVTLRVVASNMECGQYRRQRGSKTVTVSFREPVRGVVLFEKTVDHIPANALVNSSFKTDTFRFDDMFTVLYPPYMISKTHGLDVHWEIQLIHPEFVDHELEGPREKFKYEDFLQDELTFEI